MRLDTERFENLFLAPYATKASETKGRAHFVEPCLLRTDFQRDRDRILHSKAFRRLKHKTQVFISPEGDHYRTRLTHTLEVSQIARTISRALLLNEDLTEAISLGHDLGHTPFGHTGERVLNRLTGGKFSHNEQSLRVVELLEKDGSGLNLTFEVRDGIVNHRLGGNPSTPEGKVVALADKIAYINHDIADSVEAGIISETQLPQASVKLLGDSGSKRIESLVFDVVNNSKDGVVTMSEPYFDAMMEIRTFLFDKVYKVVAEQEADLTAKGIVESLYEKYINDLTLLPDYGQEYLIDAEPYQMVADFIAGMTDGYAMRVSGVNISSTF